MSLIDDLGADFVARGVAYAVIGAAALAARGIARSTYDLDVLVVDAKLLHDEWWTAWRERGARVDVRTGDAHDPLAGVVRIRLREERPVDVVVGRDAWQARALARADHPAGVPPVVTAVDLVLLKLYAGGTQDMWDIQALLALPDGASLAREVERELPGMPATMRRQWLAVSPPRG